MKRALRRLIHASRDVFRQTESAELHRPNLSDDRFLSALLPRSDSLVRAAASFAAGELASAQQSVVDHFVLRRAPAFFCRIEDIPELAARIRRDRPRWAAALRSRVEADLKLGLKVMSRREKPLAGGFGWMRIPPGPGNDNLFSAQPHRFGFMPRLALAAHHGIETIETVSSLVADWMEAAEVGEEECYHSPLAVLYRVLALSWTFAFVAALPDSRERHRDLLYRILIILSVDTDYLLDTIGNSYPNNHLLADGFAGWYYGSLYPEFPTAAAALEKGEQLFLRELDRQFLEDGSNFEHSTHYHELGSEMATAYVLLSQRNGNTVPQAISARLRAMLAHQAVLSGPEAIPFPIGDTTEDPLFPLDSMHGWCPGAMRELYRSTFDENIEPVAPDELTAERAYWLLGGKLAPSPRTVIHNLPAVFALGGFHVQRDEAQQARLTFRSGPQESVALSAGHAHADILSVYLSVSRTPLIVNAGTYTYRLKSGSWPSESPNWRAYFAGPESKNALVLGADPFGPMRGDFRNRDVPCRVRERARECASGLSWIEYEVTGENAARGHRRGVVHVDERYWIVYDLLPEQAATRDPAMRLQFAPESEVAIEGERNVVVMRAGALCRVALGAGFGKSSILMGSMNPVGGWISPRYGELVAAPQLCVPIVRGTQCLAFLLKAGPGATANSTIEPVAAEDSWLRFEVEDGESRDVVLIRRSSDAAPIRVSDTAFDGNVLWLRTTDGAITASARIDGPG